MRGILGGVIFVLLLGGCSVSRNSFAPSPFEAPKPGISLRNASVYIYCFLDVRAASIGRPMLREFDSMLVQRLNAEGVKTTTFHFAPNGSNYDSPYLSVPIPVYPTIEAHAAEEKALGAKYRLVVFPTESYSQSIDVANSMRSYAIRWDLYDIADGRLVWSTHSVGSQASLLFGSEQDPSYRTTLIVDGFIAELKKFALL